MKLLVSKSKTNEVLIQAEDGFAASYKNGQWQEGIHFDADEQQEYMHQVRDAQQAKALYEQALKALHRKQVVA
jgi:hypothetical protein